MALRYIKLFILPFVLFVCHASGQSHYTTWYSADSNHLPQNSVKSIVQDKYGFIWLSTEGGLVRYDGENFRVFNSANMPGLTSERMYYFGGSVASDSITVRNELGELVVVSRRAAKKIPADKDNRLPGIDSHLETIHSLYFTENRKFRFRSAGTVFTFNNGQITVDAPGRHYTFRHDYQPGSRFFTIQGHLYRLYPDGSILRFYGKRAVEGRLPVALKPEFSLYINTTMDQAFLVSGREVYLLGERDGKVTAQLLYNNFDARANIMALYYDGKNDLLYMGSSNKGLLIIHHQLFSQVGSSIENMAGTDGVFYALSAYGNEVLAATGDIFDETGHKGRLPIGSFSDKYMIVQDNGGDLWLKAFTTLFRATRASGYKKALSWQLPNRVTAIAKSPDGRIWTAVSNEGGTSNNGWLYVSDPSRPEAPPAFYCNLPDRPATLGFRQDGQLWMGGRRGLYRVDLANKISYPIPGFKETHVRHICFDGPLVWIASYNKGFFLISNGRTTAFPPDRNHYLTTTHCIVPDTQGFLWITTNSGLFRVSKQDLRQYAVGKRDGVFYYRYSKNWGFNTNEFNGGCEPCGVYLNNRDIFLPSMDGIVRFNPSAIKTAMPVNEIFIDEVQVDRMHLKAKDSLVLDRNFGRVKFFINSPFFGDRYNQIIEVKLEGPISQNWLPLSENNISFSTLPPGYYTLTARKFTGFGSKRMYKEYVFYVKPAFWQTWWFHGLVIIGIIGVVITVVRIRINYIRRRSKLLENQVAERTSQLHSIITTLRRTENDLKKQVANHQSLIKTITHDIKSPLKFMSITGRYVYNELEKDPAAVKEDVESIYTASSQLYNFVDNFLEYSKEAQSGMSGEPFSLAGLASEKMEFFRTLSKARSIRIQNNVPDGLTLSRNRYLVAIVLHNLLDNAIKNTANGTIVIAAKSTLEKVCLSVKDSGRGMDENRLNYYKKLVQGPGTTEPGNGLGLQIIAELLALMSATIEVESAPGKGTCVTICFNAYSL